MHSRSVNRIAVSSTARAPSAEAFESTQDLASPCCPSKENININKSGASNLTLEPQQMKRKKKGGKNNLRKSLAWDRAFFTEEGVLDPLELSAISGVSCTGELPFISEDTPVRSARDMDFRKDKENDLSLPKLNLSSSNHMTTTSQPSHKVPSNAGSKLGSKYGHCPLPSPSPSLKRQANVGKATSSELKLPKVPGLKPGFSPTSATTRSTILRDSRAKHNHITQPDFSIQRDVELHSSFKSHKNAQKTSRATTFQSAYHSDGNLGSSSANRNLSMKMIPMTEDKANSSSKTIPVNVTQIRRESSCDSQRYDSATFGTSYFQNAHINDRTLQCLQNQMTKPSGLRMPSPSLSFFSQPKPSTFRDFPMRDTRSDVYGSQNREGLRLLDNLSRASKLHNTIKIPETRISSSDKVFEDKSNVFDSKIEDFPKKNVIVRKSHEEAEVQKNDAEGSSQNGGQDHVMDNSLNNAINDCPVRSESCEDERRNVELASQKNYAVLESQAMGAIDDQPDKNMTCNCLVPSHNSMQCTDVFDVMVQNTLVMHSDRRKTSIMPDCCEAHLEKTDPLKHSLRENDKTTDKNISKERAIEQQEVSQPSGIYCSGSMNALERREAMSESPHFESKHLHDVKILTDKLPAAEAQLQNSVFASVVEGCKNDTNLMPEVDDDINQPGESSEAQDLHQKVAMEPKHIGKVNKRLSLQNLQQEASAVHSELSSSQSLGKRHKNNLGRETSIGQPFRMAECDSVDYSFSSESCSSSISTSFDCDDLTSYGNMSDCLHENTQRIETNNSPHTGSMIHHFSADDTHIKETEEQPCKQFGSMDNGLPSKMSLKDSEFDIDNLKGLQHTKTLLVQSSESNMVNNCYLEQSECIEVADNEYVAENLVLRNDCLLAKHLLDVSSEVDLVGSKKISRSSTPTTESRIKHEVCIQEFETGGCTEDAVTDPSVQAFSDTIKVGVFEDTNNSLGYLHPKLNHDKVENTLLLNNEHGDGLEEKKTLSVVIPPNATPFSDEWLAAIEAAGEDILTRKSGAVQNSPPEKSVPEPSPWSPVKRKNNQIGPFDCTKKITAPSEF